MLRTLAVRLCTGWLAVAAPALLASEMATVAPIPPTLDVVDPDGFVTTLTAAEFAGLPSSSVSLSGKNGEVSRWDGVALIEILNHLGVPEGKALRGPALRRLVRVVGADGYQVLFTLAELDRSFGDASVVLADRQNGHPLAGDGPYRLVVYHDRLADRWVRNVRRVELIDLGAAPSAAAH